MSENRLMLEETKMFEGKVKMMIIKEDREGDDVKSSGD